MKRIISLVLLVFLIPALGMAQTFPTDDEWEAIMKTDPVTGLSTPLTDVVDDGQGPRDIVGDIDRPAAFLYQDADYLYARLRLNVTPLLSPGNVAPYSWGLLFDTDGDLDNFEIVAVVSGITNPDTVKIHLNSQTNPTDPTDAFGPAIFTQPFALLGRVELACNQSTNPVPPCFSNNNDFFLDFAVPISVLVANGADMDQLRVIVAAGNADNRFNGDFAGEGDTIEELISNPVLQPRVQITSPANGSIVNTPTSSISGTAAPGATVTVIVDGGMPIVVTANATGEWTVNLAQSLADGVHTVQADALNGTLTTTTTISFEQDTIAPALSITAPVNGSVITNTTPSIIGTTEPGVTLLVSIDGGAAQTVVVSNTGDWQLDLTSSLTLGGHNVVATAIDAAGNITTASSSFIIDVDECAAGLDNCDVNATCTNLPIGFQCTCNAGFAGDGVTCNDVDECALGTDNCDPRVTCTNTVPGFVCGACPAGFEDVFGNGTFCRDIDECALGIDNCDPNTFCINTPGSFICGNCPAGFEDVNGDGSLCEDIDECTLGTDNCDPLVSCTNTVGGFTCGACPAGYDDAFGDGTFCSDIDECADDTLNNCDPAVTCTNTPGSFTCGACPGGYVDTNGDGTLCEDIDECADPGLNDCDDLVTCTNFPGTYLCGSCPTGYTDVNSNGTECVDFDECADPADNNCDPLVVCTNTPGSFTCGACPAGYIDTNGDGTLCDDLNECLLGLDNCDPLVECTNIIGGFLCGACPAGYADTNGDGTLCEDIDECADGTHDCDANLFCVNQPGTFTCENCPAGFEDVNGDGTLCEDIDECLNQTNNCGEFAICMNTPGSFACACPPGFIDVNGDGTLCEDIDECLMDPCADNVTCTNTIGGFECGMCPAGFAGDGVVCEDIDECATMEDDCDELVECINEPGGFACGECPEGYVDEFEDGTSCVNIDECEEGLDNCDQNATCTDTPGGFDCTCLPGFEGDGIECVATGAPVITSPTEGSLLSNARPTITGTAQPNSTIQITIDGGVPVDVEVDSEGNWSFTPTADLGEGNHTVEASDGENTSSVTFTVDTVPPTVSILTPVDGSTLPNPPTQVTGTAEPGATIVVILDGVQVGTTTADENGNWSVPISTAGPGSHTVEVRATDAAGNSTTVQITFDVAETVGFYLSGGACSATGGSGAGLEVFLTLLGLLALRRRRS